MKGNDQKLASCDLFRTRLTTAEQFRKNVYGGTCRPEPLPPLPRSSTDLEAGYSIVIDIILA